jgi:acyl transferase domain-containing protein
MHAHATSICQFSIRPSSGKHEALSYLQASPADDKFADYEPSLAFLFPGQGAQAVGMAKVRRLPVVVLLVTTWYVSASHTFSVFYSFVRFIYAGDV